MGLLEKLLKKNLCVKEKNKSNIIYIKEVRPEMTQCRIVQIDKRNLK